MDSNCVHKNINASTDFENIPQPITDMNIDDGTNLQYASVTHTNKLPITSTYSNDSSQKDHTECNVATNIEIDNADIILTTNNLTNYTPINITPFSNMLTNADNNNNNTNQMEIQDLTHGDQILAALPINHREEHATQNNTYQPHWFSTPLTWLQLKLIESEL